MTRRRFRLLASIDILQTEGFMTSDEPKDEDPMAVRRRRLFPSEPKLPCGCDPRVMYCATCDPVMWAKEQALSRCSDPEHDYCAECRPDLCQSPNGEGELGHGQA